MTKILKAIRLPECLLVLSIGFLSFKQVGTNANIQALVTLFFIVATTMLQNDWRDRIHDLKKDKAFATKNSALFLFFLTIFWLTAIYLTFNTILHDKVTGSILLFMLIVGALYSEARYVPFLSVTLVTITVASATLLPLGEGVIFYNLLPLASVVALVMFGRETLHDIADMKADIGYKKTLPIILGQYASRILSVISIVLGCIIALTISWYSIVGSLCIMYGLLKVLKDSSLKIVRQFVDIGMFLLAIGFFLN